MPILPTLESSQSVFSTGTLAPQVISSSAADFGGLTAQAGEKLGATAGQVSGNINDLALRQKAIEDETTVNDQYYKTTFPAITNATQTYLSKQGKDAVDGLPAYQQQLEDIRSQQRDQLANPQQQKLFDTVARKTIAFNYDGAARHATQQNKVYEDQTSAGMVSAAGSLAVQNWGDPIGFNVGLQSGVSEIMTHSQFRGEPVEYALKKVRDFTSATYTSRLMEMANTDAVGAYDLFKNGETITDKTGVRKINIQSQIDPAALPGLEAHLMAGAKNQFASIIAHDAIYKGSVVDPANLYAATQGAVPLQATVEKMESNGQDFDKDGKLLTSSAGAQGKMQVVPATQLDPGYGVTPARNNSPAEIARVGRDYLGAMTAKYQNNALTLAAYNAGPGMVDDWLAGTNKTGKNGSLLQIPDPRTGAISDADFAARIPFSETKGYVSKGLSMVGGGKAGVSVPGPDVADIRVPSSTVDNSTWGKREDGTAKGSGFLGVLRRPDGGVSTEISVGVQINGKETEIPTLVPTLTRAEVNTMLNLPDGQKVPDSIIAKATAFAKTRIAQGKSPFAGANDGPDTAAKPVALPTTAELKTQLPGIAEATRAAALRMFPNDPAYADSVAARTLNQGNTILQGVTAQENAARDTITRMMVGSKPDGSDRVTSVDQLLSTPAGKQAWAQATPEVQMAVQKSLAKPQDVPMTKEGLTLYYRLKGQAANDPNAFVQQNLADAYGQLPIHQVLDLINLQTQIGKKDGALAEKSLAWSRTKTDVDDMLKPLGLGNSAKAGTDESKTTEVFYGKLQDALEAYHDQNKKFPDTTATRKIAASLLTQGTQGEDHWYSFGNKTTAFQSPDLTQFKATVPDDQKPMLRQSFFNVYKRQPTDAELADVYTKYQLSKRGGK